jgi:hypothetical protein
MIVYKETTKKLYELLKSKRMHTNVEEVKEIFEKGIDIQGVYCKCGGLLYTCINVDCPPEVLEYLYKQGVQDEKTIVELGAELSMRNEQGERIEIMDDEFAMYATCKNLLIWWYHKLIGSCRIYNQLGEKMCQNLGTVWEHDHILNYTKKVYDNEGDLENCKKYCEILGIDYDDLKNEYLELPNNIMNLSEVPTWMFD